VAGLVFRHAAFLDRLVEPALHLPDGGEGRVVIDISERPASREEWSAEF
jgi:hypothetical protein